MGYENVKLWFAKDEENNIITIDEINEKNNTYTCPVCGSQLNPKAMESKRVTPHFAHIDASKCNNETMIHWWFKHKFIEPDDEFSVLSDVEKTYKCKEILIEQSHTVGKELYRPDVTVVTDCGKTIFFEMAFTNSKKVRDYIDIWIELKNIVVEIDIHSLMKKDNVPTFRALFYEGKCFNIKRNDAYYNILGKYKEEKLEKINDEAIKERIKKLDWFWDDVFRYKKGEVDIEDIINLITCIELEDIKLVLKILKNQKCVNIYESYINTRIETTYREILDLLKIRAVSDQILVTKELKIKYKRVHSGTFSFDFIGGQYYRYRLYSYEVDILKETTEKILSNLNKKINILKSIDLENNAVFREASNDILNYYDSNSEYLEITANRYRHWDSARIEVKIGSDHRFSITVPDALVVSTDINEVKSFLKLEISKTINGLCCFKDIRRIKIILEGLYDKYNDYLIRKQSFHKEFRFKNTLKFNYRYTDKYIKIHFKITGLENIEHKIKIQISDLLSESIFDDSKLESILLKELVSLIVNIINNYKCISCDDKVIFKKGEIEFFINKGFELPLRCKTCRQKRKQQKERNNY